MTLRDDLIPVVDDAMGLIDELGFRSYQVSTRTRTWSGGQNGSGTPTDVDVHISPTPKVSEVPERVVFDAPGKYESGDRTVSQISASYTREHLDGGTLAAGTEFFWLLDDGSTVAEYAVVGVAEKRPLEWRLTLRRRNRKRS
jgi:hypothetical protein